MSKGGLGTIALVFLRLGFTAFGGPAAHIAMMEEEIVRRRHWLTRQDFLDLLGAVNLIPGPNSTELAIFIGFRRGGWAGLLVAGLCFILPAALIVCVMAWAYVRYGNLPATEALFYGIKPVVVAIVLQALYSLAGAAVKTRFLAVVGLAAVALTVAGLNQVLVLVVAGFCCVVQARGGAAKAPLLMLPLAAQAAAAPTVAATVPFSLLALFLVFLKIGSVLFGSGYVLLAFLRQDFVEARGWLTEAQLLDAVAVGQFTPGPVFTTATFIGYLLGGVPAAAVATLGIFLPSFVLVALSGPLISRIRKSRRAGTFLDGVNVASLALMAVVAWELAGAAVVDIPTGMLAAASWLLLYRWNINSAWLILGGAVAGIALS